GECGIRPVTSTPVRRSLTVAIVVLALLGAACSTPVYTSDKAVSDLERQSSLTHRQAQCVVTAIRSYFKQQIVATQKANKGRPLPADRLKLEGDGARAAPARARVRPPRSRVCTFPPPTSNWPLAGRSRHALPARSTEGRGLQ